MSGKEGGNFDSIKRIHKAGERVLGKSQGAHGLRVMRISSHEGFSERGKQDSTSWAHPQTGAGQWGQPLPQALGTELGQGWAGIWAYGQSWEQKEPRPAAGTDVSGSEMSLRRSLAGASGLLMPSRLGQDGPVENLTLLDIFSENFSATDNDKKIWKFIIHILQVKTTCAYNMK